MFSHYCSLLILLGIMLEQRPERPTYKDQHTKFFKIVLNPSFVCNIDMGRGDLEIKPGNFGQHPDSALEEVRSAQNFIWPFQHHFKTPVCLI